MQLLTHRTNEKNAATVIPLDKRLPLLYTARLASISQMSGYPNAMHSIGRLQRAFRLDTLDDLLFSLLKLSNMAFVTAEVIDTLEATKVNRFQMDRTMIIAYVANIVNQTKIGDFSEDELDIIAHLVVSYEANTSAWTLSGGEGTDDLHIKVKSLYQALLNGKVNDGELPVYDPTKKTIVKLAMLPRLRSLLVEPTEEGAPSGLSPAFHNAATLYRLAFTRVVDHIYQLLLDKDTWYAFVAPRNNAELETSLERAKSLRAFALYCQSLLSYYQFFNIEMFMESYEQIQKWLLTFPPLSNRTQHLLESVIRSHDLLGAKEDVRQLMSSWRGTESSFIQFPEEFLATYGLSEILAEREKEAMKFELKGDLSNLKSLNQPNYVPIISGVAASTLDVVYKVATTMNVGESVAEYIRTETSMLLPMITGNASDLIIDRFKRIGIKCTIPFELPTAHSYEIASGTRQHVEGGRLYLDSAAAPYAADYHRYVRDKLKFTFTTDRAVAITYPFFGSPTQVVDKTRMTQLQELLGHSWRTMGPSWMFEGDRLYDYATLTSSPDSLRMFLEDLIGLDYEVFIRQLYLPHMRRLFATFASSFAVLYVDSNVYSGGPSSGMTAEEAISLLPPDVAVKGDVAPGLTVVQGHGSPYGTSYSALAAKQGPLSKDTPLIAIGGHMYLRLLTDIPQVTDTLMLQKDFYLQKPVLYFASNSASIKVEKFAVTSGLFNFALLPVFNPPAVPLVHFTNRYVYLNQKLYANIDLYYQPKAPAGAREVIDIPVKSSNWVDDRRQFFLEYKHFGAYSGAASHGASADVEALTRETVEKIENMITKDEKEQTSKVDGVASATQQAAAKVKEAVKDVETEEEVQTGSDEGQTKKL